MKRILTYGTFDLLHYDHIRLLQRAPGIEKGTGGKRNRKRLRKVDYGVK